MSLQIKNIKIRHALIGIITVSLITLSISSIILNSIIFTDVFEQNIKNDLLPNQLAKVKARIKNQLSTPLELSKAINQNKFLIDWAKEGEPESNQQNVIDYLKYMQQQNNALVVFWVSNVSKNYLNQDGVLKVISEQNDGWFYSFINSDKEYEVAFDFDEGSSKLTAFINYKVTAGNQDLAIAGLGYSVSEISEDILTNKIGDTGMFLLQIKKVKLLFTRSFRKVSSED